MCVYTRMHTHNDTDTHAHTCNNCVCIVTFTYTCTNRGHVPPGKYNLEFRTSKMGICWVFRPSKCSTNNTHIQYLGSAFVAIQLSRKLLLVLNVSDPRLIRCVLTLAHGANLKLQQANARTRAKVARARARVCRGLATPLCTEPCT